MTMADVRGRTFTGGEIVEMDDSSFTDCAFEDATLRYAGGALPRFENCSFVKANWYFTGPALRTIQLLQVFANQEGGRGFVDDLFKPGNYIGE
jgi:hypothetical protein